MQITLQNKIINLTDFFKRVADRLRQETKFERFHFLVPDDKNGYYMTKYSTCGSTIKLTSKKLHYWDNNFQEDIFYPKVMIRHYDLLKRISLKIHWKMRLHNASAVMPIYGDNGIICLILFTDRYADDWLKSHSHYINAIKQEFTNCLEGILLYNQTLERIIRECDRSNRQPVCPIGEPPVDQLIDEHRGTINIDSPGEGKGTTITVTLPLTQPALPKKNNKK